MNKSKGMQIGAMLAAILLLSMAFVPAVSAQANNPSKVSGLCKTCEVGCTVTKIQIPKVNENVLQGEDRANFLEKTLKSDKFKEIKSEFISRGYAPEVKEAKVTSLSNIDTGESGVRVDIPFRTGNESILAIISTYSSYKKQETIGYIHNGEKTEILPHPSSNQGIGIQAIWIPGYHYEGTYSLDDICFVIGGACVAFWIFGVATGGTCEVLDGGCWLVEYIMRYSSCQNPNADLYHREWWNIIGPVYLVTPSC